MKTLLITRHAKSSWDTPGLRDFDRPLNNRGLHDAPRMGKLLKEKNLTPGLIISSKARRARETAEIMAEHSGYKDSIRFSEDLYGGDATTYLNTVIQEADSQDLIMIIGHNPNVEVFLKDLTGLSERMPTATIAKISLPIDEWEQLSFDVQGELEKVWRPKEI